MKYLLFIGDGMADNPVPELGGLTPLEYANIPTIDALSAKGVLGSVSNCPAGLPAGSDTAITSIFGCDPRKYYTGRAPLEAAATGIKLNPGDIAYRCNMVTYEDGDQPFAEKRILSHSAGSIEGDVSDAVLAALFADADFAAAAAAAGMVVHPGHSFRHIAVQSGHSTKGLKLIPPHDHLGEAIGPILPSGNETAAALLNLMRLAHEKLDHLPLNEERRAAGKLPANGIWFWAEGTAVELPCFVDQFGHRGGVVSAVPLCHGIAALTGLEPITVEGATGEIDTNLENKVAAVLRVLETYDFAALHVEAPDECTHNGDLKGKLQSIEWLDSRCMAPLTEAFAARGWDYRILLLSDHKTLTSTRGHDGDPVPFLLYDSTKDTGLGLAYNEKNGLKGPYYPDGANTCMKLLFDLPL
ncbi:MAG: alkaline phosphatase family protein [Oscillospiraceae bacterium]|nr:alkaline phosphatase family protein [Oscillospiraceae bacterium]MCD8256429.1 alkaline phosphatase family protein [Oscillospiraceae bacterium]MCD8359022.1 alkaline phosphatase family protein [Oscillospiraceae bacterium]